MLSGKTGFTRTEAGFTLIELMLVVIIIGTLAAIVIPRFTGRAEQARNTAAKADLLSNIPLALDLYELDNGSFPTTEQGLASLVQKPNISPLPKNWNGPYLKKKPVDPWGQQYVYVSPGVHNKDDYDLHSLGKDGVAGGGDDLTNWEE
ncbi:MAG: type II secretion system major pseudopilin GspG [Candidatus Omnitrophota bacterium]